MLFSVASYRSYWKGENTSTLELLQRGQFSHICCNLHVVSVLLVKMVKPGQDLAKMKPSDLPPTYHGHADKEDSITRDQSVHEGSKNNECTFFHERRFTTVHFFAEINLLRMELEKCKTILTQHKNLHYLHMVSHFISTVSLIVFLYWQTGISYVVN